MLTSIRVRPWLLRGLEYVGRPLILMQKEGSPCKTACCELHVSGHATDEDTLLLSRLVEEYGKCGALQDARMIFDRIDDRPILAWKSIIRAYVQEGKLLDSIQLFEQLLQEGHLADMFTFSSILNACANLMESMKGKRIHAIATVKGFVSDVGTALVNMYGKCGMLKNSRSVFYDILERRIIAWNVMIAAHAKFEEGDKSLFFFNQMQQEGVLPSKVTFINILTASVTCSSFFGVGIHVHARICSTELHEHVDMGNAVINMSCRYGKVKDAKLAFDALLKPNIVSWTSMLETYSTQGQGLESLQLFQRMQQEGTLPDSVTFMTIIDSCAGLKAMSEGKRLHACLVSMCTESDIAVGTTILHMYGECDDLECVDVAFDKLRHHNLISKTSVIGIKTRHGQYKEAIQCFYQSLQEGLMPDKVILFSLADTCCQKGDLMEGKRVHTNLLAAGYELDSSAVAALISLYIKYRSPEEAFRIFNNVSDLSVCAWNAVLAALNGHGEGDKALQLFIQMLQEGMMPDKLTYASVIDASSSLVLLLGAKQLHAQIFCCGFEGDNMVSASLVKMYGKCGLLEEAQAAFNQVSKKSLISWTSLISTYAQHGEPDKALQTLNQAISQKLRVDDITFSNVLSACSRTGFLDQGWMCFLKMMNVFKLKPTLDHFCCMIDLLARSGHLDDAEALVEKMPCQPSAVLWMALLGACRQQMDVRRGEQTARNVLELDPEKGGLYSILSNIYASVIRNDTPSKALGKIRFCYSL